MLHQIQQIIQRADGPRAVKKLSLGQLMWLLKVCALPAAEQRVKQVASRVRGVMDALLCCSALGRQRGLAVSGWEEDEGGGLSSSPQCTVWQALFVSH